MYLLKTQYVQNGTNYPQSYAIAPYTMHTMTMASYETLSPELARYVAAHTIIRRQ